MTVLKINAAINSPEEVLEKVKLAKPKQVLILWIDQNNETYMSHDATMTIKDMAYFNKALDIYTQEALTQ